jgi:predicted secreted Zn-dependent protease
VEEAFHERLPERGLVDSLARTAHVVGWTRHFRPASGSDPKIRDTSGSDSRNPRTSAQ